MSTSRSDAAKKRQRQDDNETASTSGSEHTLQPLPPKLPRPNSPPTGSSDYQDLPARTGVHRPPSPTPIGTANIYLPPLLVDQPRPELLRPSSPKPTDFQAQLSVDESPQSLISNIKIPTLPSASWEQPSSFEPVADLTSTAFPTLSEGCKDFLQYDEPGQELLPEPEPTQPPPTLDFFLYPELTRPPSPISCLEFEDPTDNNSFDTDSFENQDQEDVTEEELLQEETFTNFIDSPNRPVYADAPITLHQSFVSILTLALVFSLSQQCIQAILKLINFHCSKKDNIFKETLYFFKKYFSYIRGDVDYEYYCSKCFKRSPKEGCQDENCKLESGKFPPLCYIIKLNLLEQLKTMMKRKGFYSKLDFQKSRDSADGLTDFKDGALYKQHEALKLLTQLTITMNWYTDGAALFTSSKLSVWPVYLSINELPYSERYRKENILVPVLWCGPVKPHGNMLLTSMEPALSELRKGVSMEVYNHGIKDVKGILIAGTGDTPARALMLHMVQHNGENSCQKCYQKGECREGHFGVRVFPHAPKEMKVRTVENSRKDSNYARLRQDSYMGFKGITALSSMTLDYIRGTSIDVMHLIYGGIAKANLKFFVDKKYSDLGSNVSEAARRAINERLTSIRPPHYITRIPKSVDDLAVWKTSEYKSMFLYYILPVLCGIVSSLKLRHLGSLVAAIQLLNAEVVTAEMIEKASQLIDKYVSYFEDLYDRAYMTLSVHLLLHLADLVKDLGPLWTTSCFPLESINGIIMKLVHGTRYPEMQIASSLNMCLGLPDLVDNLDDNDIKSFCIGLLTRTNKCHGVQVGNSFAIGQCKKITKLPISVQENFQHMNLKEDDFVCFTSLRKDRILYTKESHRTARDCSSVIYTDADGATKVGMLTDLFKPTTCLCVRTEKCACKIYAVIQKLKQTTSFSTLISDIDVPNTHGYEKLDEYCLITANQLQDVCVKMVIDGKLFISKRCNRVETE